MIRILEELDAKEITAFDQLFSGLKRKPVEPIDQFADRVSSVVRRAYPGLDEQLINDYAIKHFLRALDDPDIAMSLELTRSQGMDFDQFVTMAARAEATRKAVRSCNRGQNSRTFPTFSGQVHEPQTNYPQQRQVLTCYNCNRIVHVSRECREPRRNNQTFNNPSNKFVRETNGDSQMPNRSYNNPRFPTPQNFGNSQRNFFNNAQTQKEVTKSANCIQLENAPVVNNLVACVNVNQKLEELKQKILSVSEGRKKELSSPPAVGKLVVMEFEVCKKKAQGMVDGGAQVSLISAQFLHSLFKDESLRISENCFGHSNLKVSYFNGKTCGWRDCTSNKARWNASCSDNTSSCFV
ncbi:hypothetical protein niasHT_037179 [Heterodera trifolii]|uniref:CCHC-type domain-containing protein n=1 Tax=Heterodera trifolii TaxID=157864 RepID=A0ABD2I104_9BILA